MAKPKSVYRCTECGHEHPKWVGRCEACGEWNSVAEEPALARGGKGGKSGRGGRVSAFSAATAPVQLSNIAAESLTRWRTGLPEFDFVLGGGIVPGSMTLIGGEPGIGKSTLLLQAAARLEAAGRTVLYASGEESPDQIRLRADRLVEDAGAVHVLGETRLEAIIDAVGAVGADVVVIDSIQTVFLPGLESAPGSVSQVRECAARLMLWSKGRGTATFLVGHVTKDGAIAGPRVLEHLVDTVLYFEGEQHHSHRVLRAVKNRFGSTNEIGVFEMGEQGLTEVTNPSGFFLAERPRGAAGSVIVSSLEGSRPLLLELQALVTPASFGTPRRTVLGADYNRVCLLLAVLEKRVGFPLQSQDVFVNVAGGGRVTEPAADLGVIVAAASSYLDRPVRGDTVIMGEVGLAGEVRAVAGLAVRLKEAAALGFTAAVVPHNNLAAGAAQPLEVQGVSSVDEAVKALLGR